MATPGAEMPTDQLVPALADAAPVSAATATRPPAASLTSMERFELERIWNLLCEATIASYPSNADVASDVDEWIAKMA
jgi:hypothetical protein